VIVVYSDMLNFYNCIVILFLFRVIVVYSDIYTWQKVLQH